MATTQKPITHGMFLDIKGNKIGADGCKHLA